MSKQPLVTIVTPSFNQGEFIRDTIESVLAQTYPNIEHIVVDGGSTDQTVQILEQYGDRIRWVSEPDNGQSDAINKGWRMANGEIWTWLNSDDFLSPDAVTSGVRLLNENPTVGTVYGDALYIDSDGKSLGVQSPGPGGYERLRWRGQHIKQPASFVRADVVRKGGFLVERYHAKMDLDFFIRMAQVAPTLYYPEVWATQRVYNDTKSMSNLGANWLELLSILKKHNPYWFISPLFMKYIRFRVGYMLPEPVQLYLRERRGLARDVVAVEGRNHR